MGVHSNVTVAGIEESFHNLVNTTHEESHAGGHHGELNSEAMAILFIFLTLCCAGLVKEVNKKTGIPYTPMLFMIGMILGKFAPSLGLIGKVIKLIENLDPRGILMIFLPVIVFEGGFNTDFYVFRRQIGQIFLLAFPCVVVAACFLAISLKVVLGYDDSYYTWIGAFLFGSVLSATDTVAVLALLKEVGAPKKFSSLIEGESLLNDATCMVLLDISMAIYKGQGTSIFGIVKLFISLVVGGVFLGVLFGLISSYWIKRIFNDEILVVNITVLSCYLLYFVAEHVDIGFKVSGIMALVSLGLFMSAFGKTKISSESDHAVKIFWKILVYVAESVIFMLAGMIVGIKVLSSDKSHLTETDNYKLFALYFLMMVSRFLAISVFMPWLSKWGYGLNWKEVVILSYGGLRGAIGIAFALIVHNDSYFDDKYRTILLFDIAGCAVLTLIINGTTTGILIKKMGMTTETKVKSKIFIHIINKVIGEIDNKIQEVKPDRFLNMVDWDTVKDMNCVNIYQKNITKIEAIMDKSKKTEKLEEGINLKAKSDMEMDLLHQHRESKGKDEEDNFEEDVDGEVLAEGRNKFLMTLKNEYWELLQSNQISGDALILLVESADWDLDNENSNMNSWEFISNGLINSHYCQVLFKMRFMPVFGKIARNMLFNHICFAYDVVIGYISAHERAEENFVKFALDEKIVNDILRESVDNREAAEEYLYNYLNLSYPEITKAAQIKKATSTVLEHQKYFITDCIKCGQIDEKEFKFFKKKIDSSIKNLSFFTPEWSLPHIKEFIKEVGFFKFLSSHAVDTLLLEADEKVYEKDEKIIKEHDRAKGFFVITRGTGRETSSKSSLREKKGVGSVISYHHLISQTFRYQTTFTCDCVVYATVFPLESIKKIMKTNDMLVEHVWKESMIALVKLFKQELHPLSKLGKENLWHLLSICKFKKYQKGQVIDMAQGGVFLKGQMIHVFEKNPTPIENMVFWAKNAAYHSPNQSQKSEIHSMMSPENNSSIKQDQEPIKTIALLVPTYLPYTFSVDKSAYVFHFENLDEAVRIMCQERAFEKRGTRISGKSFRTKETKASLLLSTSSPASFTQPQAQKDDNAWKKSKSKGEDEDDGKSKIKRMLSPTVEESIEEEDHRVSDHIIDSDKKQE